ncbi:hypothetical protein [Natronorubrum aibiense]|uniref:Uncharacterized protein n=1 Tax=Natronorubrum aibiense TaxID=348826 RepID=A0A5P9P4G0_9EURY|nr:hypothetical protein [Natronorubrum aibiense]QFU83023.1 hypothetical protein GCU68_10995 [Natronorubrum aibiense]
MSRSEPHSRIVAVCRACDSVYVAEQHPNGTIRPIGVSEECTCGDGDFQRVTVPNDADPTAARSSN